MSLIFLTGSQGFLGSHLMPKLISLGHLVETDMRYLHTTKYACIIHLASKNNIKNEFDADLIESNIILTKEIFKSTSRILYASSCVAAFPLNPYAYSKLYSEHLGAIHGNALGLRFQNIYGPRNNKGIVWWLMKQEDGTKITIRGKDLIRDYIHVDDVVNEIISNIPRYETKRVPMSQCRGKNCRPIWRNHLVEKIGVKDVGTGVGTTTEQLVELYMKLSGKTFIIDVEEAGDNEPASMISNNIVPHMSLEEGLKKIING